MIHHPYNRPRGARLRACWLVTVLLAVALAGCGRPDTAALLDSARLRIEQRDFDGAAIDAKNVLQAQPESAAGRYVFGRALLGAGDLTGAESELGRARRFGHPDHEVLPALAEVLLARGRPRDVVVQFSDTQLADERGAADLGLQLARSHLALGDLASAEAAMAGALRRLPTYLPGQLLQARVVSAQGDAAAARRMAADLVQTHPREPEAWVLHGELLAADGKGALDAAAAFRRALELSPRLSAAHGGLVNALLGAGDLKGAEEAAAAMRKALPSAPQAVYHQALVAYLKQDFAAAREHMQSLTSSATEDPRLLLLAGTVESRLGALVQAETMLSKAAWGMPDAVKPRVELALVYLQQGQPKRALAAIERLLASQPQDATLWRVAGQAHARAGDFRSADEAFDRARRLRPDDPALRVDAARVLVARGSLEAGLRALQAAADTDPQGIAAELELVSAHLRRRDKTAALAAVDAIERKQPGTALPDYLRGQVHRRSGDVPAARAALERALAKDGRSFQVVQALAELDLLAQQPDAARQRYEALLKRDPRSSSAMLALAGLTRRTGGSRQQAAGWLDRAVQANALDAQTWRSAIEFHRSDGDGAAALARAQAAAVALPNDPELMALLADCLLAERDVQQAISTLNRLVELRRDSADAHLRLAGAHVAANNLSRARQLSERALQLDPESPLARRTAIGLALLDQRPSSALDLSREVQRRQPRAALGWQLEGEIAMHQGDAQAGAAAFRKALANEPGTEVAMQLYVALQRAGRAAEASQHARSWLQAQPQDLAFVSLIGEQAMAAGDWATAETHYRQALKLQPDSPMVLNNLAYTLLQRKDPGALAMALRAERAAPFVPSILDTLAQAYAAANQIGKAVEWQTRAVEMAPRSAEFRLRLARLHLAAGSRSKAREELQRLERQGGGVVPPEELQKLMRQAQG